MNILLTGVSGFVGSHLAKQLSQNSNFHIIGVSRSTSNQINIEYVNIKDISGQTHWSPLLKNIDVVIHLAARAHIMNEYATNPLAEYRKVNTEGTLHLAEQAAKSGVKRFIFLSSVKVLGEETPEQQPFSDNSPYNPLDYYGKSKMEAEKGLKDIFSNNKMEVVIIRPPLIYGPNVKANFRKMMLGINKMIPLPLGGIKNKRSLISINNLSDLIITCIKHPNAANQTFLASDGIDLSTSELSIKIGKALKKKVLVFTIPIMILRLIATLLNKEMAIQRLCGSLQVDISKTKQLLNWTPPFSIDQSLKETAESLLPEKNPNHIKRVFDFTLASVAIMMLLPVILFVSAAVKLTSSGPILYWSQRVGRDNKVFLMPKFRSMKMDTPSVATHLLSNPKSHLTSIGSFLRKTSLDELPQLWSILKGDMSLVGPRPALYNQEDLISLRTQYDVHKLVPGLTGWAQINGRDELPIPEKVKLDSDYVHKQSFWFDVTILWSTFVKIIKRDGVSH